MHTELINLKRDGKENETNKPAIDQEHLKQLKNQGCLFAFFSPLACKKFLVAYRSFLLPKRPSRTAELSNQKLQPRVVGFRLFEKLIQI